PQTGIYQHYSVIAFESGAAAEHRRKPGALGDLDRAARPEELRLLRRLAAQEFEQVGGVVGALLGHSSSRRIASSEWAAARVISIRYSPFAIRSSEESQAHPMRRRPALSRAPETD